jgi:hypothetical protein
VPTLRSRLQRPVQSPRRSPRRGRPLEASRLFFGSPTIGPGGQTVQLPSVQAVRSIAIGPGGRPGGPNYRRSGSPAQTTLGRDLPRQTTLGRDLPGSPGSPQSIAPKLPSVGISNWISRQTTLGRDLWISNYPRSGSPGRDLPRVVFGDPRSIAPKLPSVGISEPLLSGATHSRCWPAVPCPAS